MRCSLQVRSPGGPHPCSPRSIVSDNCSSPFSQPLPTLKESGGLKITEWYSPGLRAIGPVGFSGRGRPLACSWPPAPLQALSAKTRSVASSPTTSSSALALRLLTPVMLIFPSPDRCRRERALSAAPPRVGCYLGSILPYGGRRITQMDYLWCCLGVTCGSELPRIPIPRTWLNRSKKEGRRLLCSEGQHVHPKRCVTQAKAPPERGLRGEL